MKLRITLEQVKQAIEALEKASIKVTCKAIKQHCGGGSYSTICKHLRALGKSDARSQTKSFDLITYIVDQVSHVLSSKFCTKDEFERLRQEVEARNTRESLHQESPAMQSSAEAAPLTQIQSVSKANEAESFAPPLTETEL